MTVTLPKEEYQKIIDLLSATSDRMRKIGEFANNQIRDRFNSGGASSGKAWPASSFGTMGHKPPLAGLENTFDVSAMFGEAKVASDSFIAMTHQLGTQSKGGTLPDIVPIHALSLYVPLTPLGVRSHEAHKSRAHVLQTVYAGASTLSKPKGTASIAGMPQAKYGVDFLLLSKVSLPPRPQLPVSDQEIGALARFTIATLKNG